MKIRLWGTGEECAQAAERLMRTPGLIVVSVSAPYPDHGASVLVRVFIEARLDPPPAADHAASAHAHDRRPL